MTDLFKISSPVSQLNIYIYFLSWYVLKYANRNDRAGYLAAAVSLAARRYHPCTRRDTPTFAAL